MSGFPKDCGHSPGGYYQERVTQSGQGNARHFSVFLVLCGNADRLFLRPIVLDLKQ